MPAFLSPWFLLATLAAAVPLALHLLKREPEPRVRFSAVALLRNAPVERSSTRRLRQIVLLLLRVAALVLLALAFARPFLRARAVAAARGATVVAIDTSFSLSAPGRFARAQQLARDAVQTAPVGDDVAVVAFADRAELLAPLSPDRAGAVAAIDGSASGAGGTRYLDAVNLAGRTLGSRAGRIVVVTDLQERGWDAGDRASVPEGTRVEIRDVGPLPDNLAVTAVRPDGSRVVVSVRNESSRARIAAVRLTVDGHNAAEQTVTLPAGSTAEAVFQNVSGTEAVAAIDDRDGLQADNVRYALLKGARPAVLVVSATGALERDAFYVRQALAAGGTSGELPVTGAGASQLAGWTSDRLGGYTAVVLMSTRGLDRRGRDLLAAYLTAGGGLLAAIGPDVDGDVVADLLGASARLQVVAPDERRAAVASLAPADIRHPVFQPFGEASASLGLVRFSRAARVTTPSCQTIARFTTGDAAVLDCAAGDGRAIIVASDLDNRWNDFPLHATFVPFVHECVRYLSSASARSAEYLVAEVPAGVPLVPGFVRTPETAGARARVVAINVDPGESEPARMTGDEFGVAVTRLKDAAAAENRVAEAGRESSQHIWQYLLIGMLALLGVEGLVAARAV